MSAMRINRRKESTFKEPGSMRKIRSPRSFKAKNKRRPRSNCNRKILQERTTLSKQGLTPLTRLTEDQRAIALQRSRQLENGARLADARRILEDYGRRLERTDDDRRLRLLRELQEAVAELEKVRTQLQAVGEKLLYVGAIKSQIASGNLGEPEIAIYRKVEWSAIAFGRERGHRDIPRGCHRHHLLAEALAIIGHTVNLRHRTGSLAFLVRKACNARFHDDMSWSALRVL